MKRKFKILLRVMLIFFSTLIAVNCTNEESSNQQKPNAAIDKAQKWFRDYEADGDNLKVFQNLNYEWTNAEVKKAKDGTEFITVPIDGAKKEVNENWEQKLFIYRLGTDSYKVLLYEFYPENQTTVDLDNFNGYISVWDLKKGFVRSAKFANNIIVENGVVEVLNDKQLKFKSFTNKQDKKNLDDENSNGDGGFQPTIPLREVVIENSYKDDSYVYVYFPRDTDNSGSTSVDYTSNPSGGGAGGSGGVIVNKNQSQNNPCDQIKDILNFKPNDQNSLKASINWLKSKVNATVNNKECGVEIKKLMNPDQSYRYEFTQVLSVDQFSIPLTTGFSYVGGLHSHPADGYAMFSYQDVRFLLEAYDGASDSRKAEVFNSVVCKDNAGNTNVYMIKIDNIDALRTQVNAVWNNPKYAGYSTEKEKIEAIHLDQGIKYAKSKGELEKSFLEQFASFGITMYKADAGLNNFNKLNLNNSTVTPIPCN